MRGIYGAVFVAGAAILVCCSADPHRESGDGLAKRYDVNGHKNRILHPVFEARGADNPQSSYGDLLKMLDYVSREKEAGKYRNDDFSKRNFDEIDRSNMNTMVSKRNMDEIDRSNMPFPYAIKRFYHLYESNYLDLDTPVAKEAGKYPMSPYESSLYGGLNDDFSKRNFDEIDRRALAHRTTDVVIRCGRRHKQEHRLRHRSNMNTMVSKRNMDEIDRSNMPFPYAIKRFYHLYGSNYLDLDTPVSSFDKKRYRPDYPMDEIDLSHFPIGSKRSLALNFPLARNLQ